MAAPSPWSWAGFYEGIILLGSVWRQGWDEEWWGIKIGSADFIKDGTAARLLRHDFNPATLCQPPPFRPPTLNSQTKSKHIAQERTLGKKDKKTRPTRNSTFLSSHVHWWQTLTSNMSTKPTSMHTFSQISHTCTHQSQHSKSQVLATSHKGTTLICKLCTSFANLALNLATSRKTSQDWASIPAITSGSAGVIPSSRSPPSSHLLSLIDFEALSPSLVFILWFVAFPVVTRL